MKQFIKTLGLVVGLAILFWVGVYFLLDRFPGLLFYNKTYKKNTQLRGYLLTDEQIVQAGNFYLENEQFFPQQLSFGELNKHKQSFMVILAKNTGNQQICGTLKCTIRNESAEVSVLALSNSKFELSQRPLWLI